VRDQPLDVRAILQAIADIDIAAHMPLLLDSGGTDATPILGGAATAVGSAERE
jgi:hypothetical protein